MGVPGCTGGDRLSELPDCLLHSILSLLKARQVVQTCVLSRRWEQIWRSVPCLHIDFLDFGSNPDDDEDVMWDKFAVFEDFADNLLCSRSASSLDTFRLDTDRVFSARLPACRWVRRALKHYSPAVLHVGIGSDERTYGHVVLPSLVTGSHRLTRLYLHNASLDDRDSENQFASASGFPVLEVLDLTGCSYYLCRIESATLKSLIISDCSNCIKEDIVIAAPCLTSLRLSLPLLRESNSRRYYATGFIVHESPSLVTAAISVMDVNQHNTYHVDEATLQRLALFRTLRKLLESISSVTSLDLSGFKATSGERPYSLLDVIARSPPFVDWKVARCIPPDMYEDIALEFDRFTSPVPLLQEVLDEAQGDLPVFWNLTTLVLDQCYISSNNLQTFWRFLLHTPMLEKLTLHCCKFPDGTRSVYNKVPDLTKLVHSKHNDTDEDGHDAVPNLKLVEIKYKERDEDGLHVALREMHIKYKDQDTQERVTVASEISKKLPKTTVHLVQVIKSIETN